MQQENNKSYRRLIVWQKADELAFQVYLITKKFPNEVGRLLNGFIKFAKNES